MFNAGDITLRPLTQDDVVLLTTLANNKKIWDNLRDYFSYPYTLDDAVTFINTTTQEDPSLTFAIEIESKFCGVIGLVPQTDVYKRTAEIGYWLGEPFWGRGIATKAVELITAYGFDQIGLVRIYTGVFEYNIASMRVLEKNSYKKEGIFEKAVLKNHRIWDEHRFSKVR